MDLIGKKIRHNKLASVFLKEAEKQNAELSDLDYIRWLLKKKI